MVDADERCTAPSPGHRLRVNRAHGRLRENHVPTADQSESLGPIRTRIQARHNGPRPGCVAYGGLTHARTIRRARNVSKNDLTSGEQPRMSEIPNPSDKFENESGKSSEFSSLIYSMPTLFRYSLPAKIPADEFSDSPVQSIGLGSTASATCLSGCNRSRTLLPGTASCPGPEQRDRFGVIENARADGRASA